MRLLVTVVILVLAAVADGGAQTAWSPPTIEFGVHGLSLGGLIDISDFEGDPQMGSRGFGPSLTINRGRFGIEATGDVLGASRPRPVFYELSLLIRPRTQRSRTMRFIRLGAGGHYESEHVPEYRRVNQDRSITVFPEWDRSKLTVPNFAVVGAGIQRVIARHAAVAMELDGVGGNPQTVAFGFRASAGVVIPLGGYAVGR